MGKGRTFLTLDEVIKHFQKQVIKSDQEFSYLQAMGWKEFPEYYKDFENQQGFQQELLKGFEQNRFLAVQELSFTVNLIRKKPSLFKRLKQAIKYIMGEDIPVTINKFIFKPGVSLNNSNHLTVNITFTRNKEGKYDYSVNPNEPVNNTESKN